MSERPDERFDQLWEDHAAAVVRYARRHVLPDEIESPARARSAHSSPSGA